MEEALAKGFIAYRLPGETEHFLCSIGSVQVKEENTDIANFDFIISPFDKFNNKSYLFKFDKVIKNGAIPFVDLKLDKLCDVSKNDYINSCNSLIDLIRTEKISKVVFSTTHSIKANVEDIAALFSNLKNAYPSAFIYILHYPEIGTWAAASPELLLSNCGDNLKTVALAGTRKYNVKSSTAWGQKEIEEHRYIEHFVDETLDLLNMEYEKTDTHSQRAGNVEHIMSTYTIKKGEHNFIKIANMLHPGPAISGYPVDAAIRNIHDIEDHDRSYYCGYLGPINREIAHHLYINLRCMQIFKNGYKIYAGGGITESSIAEDEWNETILKSKTLSEMILSIHHEDYK